MNNTVITKKEFIFNWDIKWKDVENTCKTLNNPFNIRYFNIRELMESKVTGRGYYAFDGVQEKLFEYVCPSFNVSKRNISADD